MSFSFKMKMAVKMRAEYGPVLHMPVLKEGRDKGPLHGSDPYGQPGYPLPGTSFFLGLIFYTPKSWSLFCYINVFTD